MHQNKLSPTPSGQLGRAVLSPGNPFPRLARRLVAAVFAAACWLPGALHGHNLDTSMTYLAFDADTVKRMQDRSALGEPLIQAGDVLGVVLKVTPGPGTRTGVGGYMTFYIPDGMTVAGAEYVRPDPANPNNLIPIPLKGQSIMPTGSGPVGVSSTPALIGQTLGPNHIGVTELSVTASGAHRGTIAGVYADTGIFYSTDPRTAIGSWVAGGGYDGNPDTADNILTNNSGDAIIPTTQWDADQLIAYGLKSPAAPIVDPNGRGNAPWGMANAVAGPESGYAWQFRRDTWQSTTDMQAATGTMGPWNRIKYPGSQISKDQAGLVSSALGYAGVDASTVGWDLAGDGPLPGTTNAVRFSFGMLELGRTEYARVLVQVSTDHPCDFGLTADTFGGDAGGEHGGKDHIWRYYEPTVVTVNPCTVLQKVASKQTVALGETFFFTITFANASLNDLTNVQIKDTLPPGLQFVSATPTQNSGPNPLVWNIPLLKADSVASFKVYVKATSLGLMTNRVQAVTDQGVFSAVDNVEVGARALLRYDKTVAPTSVTPGSTVTYTLTVYNDGSGPNGVPLKISELLPPGFTYTGMVSKTINGGLLADAFFSVNASNPNQPQFTISTSIAAQKSLVLKFNVLVAPTVEAGTYNNTFYLNFENKVLGGNPLAPVTVGGGRIGDTIWRDWNGDGVQDFGEEGIAGVTVRLYQDDGDGVFEPGGDDGAPIATATTDASGRYLFPGLSTFGYFVQVDAATVPVQHILTGDPDMTVDGVHYRNLAFSESYLLADFGYQPSGVGAIGDLVFDDQNMNGIFDGTDEGIDGVTVNLYEDTNGNGAIDSGDLLIATTTTAGGGLYSFTGLAEGLAYLASVDETDPVLAAHFAPNPYHATTGNPQAVANLTGTYNHADFGFFGLLPASIGDQIFIDVNGNGDYDPGTDTPLANVAVSLYRDNVLMATTVSGPDGTYLFDGLAPGSYTVVVDGASPGVPPGYAHFVHQHTKTLSAGEAYLDADFPFVPLISKTVDKPYATAGEPLTFTVNVNYPSQEPLANVRVIDPLPNGVTFSSVGQNGSYGSYVSSPGVSGVDTAAALGMAVYNNNNDTFRYRTWNVDDGFSAELTGAGMAGRINMLAGASSPTTAERVIAFVDQNQHVRAATWNGTTWTAVPVPPATTSPGRMTPAALTANSNLYWGTAVAYEQNSGHLMLVWNDDATVGVGDNELRYVTREGGVWGSGQVTTADQPQNLRIAARPNSDQLALVFSTANGSDYVMLWNGTAWGSIQTLDTTGGSLTSVNVAFESQSGRVMVVYGKPTATSFNLFYRVWDGASWSAEASITPPAGVTTQPQWVTIAADPFSNRLVTGVVTSGSRTWLTVWDGSAWGSVQEATATALVSTAMNVGVAFETFTGEALAAYGVNTAPTAQVRYRTWSPATGTWSAQQSGPSATNGNPNVIMLTRSPSTNRIMMALNTSTSRANYVSWDGTAWDDTVTEAAGNTQTTTQQPMIYLWNRLSVEQSTATFVSATPTTVALGDPITVTVQLMSNQTIADVTPALAVVGGSASCVSADTIPASVLAGVTKTFTFTCTPTGVGEFSFKATAESAGGYTFSLAQSNTVLVTQNGAANVVTWNLGSNTPAIDGSTATNSYAYAFRGAGTAAFWVYNPALNAWNNPANPADPAVNINAGGALASDGVRYVYALQGGGTQGFYRYDALAGAGGSWSALASTGVNINTGGALVYLNGYLYAFAGNNTTTFLRYDVAADAWATRTALTVGQGGALATDGTYVYGLRGNKKKEFYRYNPATNAWATLAPALDNIAKGGSLVYANGAFYALRGDNQKNFYRYTIGTNAWTRLASTAGNVNEGGALTYDGIRYIYAFQGKTTTLYRYDLTTATWATQATAPANTGWGGALAYLESGAVTHTHLTVSPLLVTDAAGDQTVKVRLTLTSNSVINNITPGALSASGVNGAGATWGAAALVSADDDLDGTSGDSVVFEWTAIVTAGAVPGSITFSANASSASPATTFGTATSNSMLITPPLSFAVTVDDPAPTLITNTAIANDSNGMIENVPSNTTETATTASIGDRVWADLNGDGVQDAGEPGLAGVQVCVYESDGVTLVGCDVTDASGYYRIFGLPAGDYVVRTNATTFPAGYMPTTAGSLNLTLAAGEQYDAADFGLMESVGTGSIGGNLWLDADNDGSQDSGEADLSGITVRLEVLLGGVWTPMATTVTAADGSYLFAGLEAGDYRIVVDTASQVTSPYAGGTFALGDTMAPTYDSDGTGTPNVVSVTLATDATVVAAVDFGYNWSGSIGDLVWWDNNGDGLQNESPLAGIGEALVILYVDVDGDGLLDLLVDSEIHRLLTDANGYYLIQNLPPGNYLVDVYEDSITTDGIRDIVPTGVMVIAVTLEPGTMDVATADFGYFEGARVEGNVFLDANQNGLFDNGETGLAGIEVTLVGTDMFGNPISRTTTTDANGNFFFIVPEGDYTLTYSTDDVLAIDPGFQGATTPTSYVLHAYPGEDGNPFPYNFGVTYNGRIGDTIYANLNGNSTQDPGEPGIAGVTVVLYQDLGSIGVLEPGIDLPLAMAVTDAMGKYLFTGLAAGNYLVEVQAASIPPEFSPVPDADPTAPNDGVSAVTLAMSGSNLDQDFGYPPVVTMFTVSGTIWDDNGFGGGTAGNGLQDGGELGLADIVVIIAVDTDRDGIVDQTYTVMTDASGFYSVGTIPEFSWITITVDEDSLPGFAYVSTYDADTGLIGPDGIISLTPPGGITADFTGQNFGYQQNFGSISGTVVGDGNGNGVADGGETGLENVEVTLRYAGPDGILGTDDDDVQTTFTDINGNYSFTDLEPGSYEITIAEPAGYFALADADGGVPTSISYNLLVGEDATAQDFEMQAGQVNGVVYFDLDFNGLYDPLVDLPLPGVTVYITDSNGVTWTAMTDLDGYFEQAVPPGMTQVDVHQDDPDMPGGLALTTNANGEGSDPTSVTVPMNGVATVNTGYVQNIGTVQGRVYIDNDGDGVYSPGIDTPLPNVAVTVTDADNVVHTVVTDGYGFFRVTVVPGEATVDVDNTDLPATAILASGSTDPTVVTVPLGGTVTDDTGYVFPAGTGLVHGTLYIDNNGDGRYDAGDTPIPNVEVIITDSNGGVYILTTDANGYYQAVVPAGTTTVDVNQSHPQYPAGATLTNNTHGEGSDPTTVNVPSGGGTMVNTGYVLPANTGTVNGTLYLDNNGNGIYDVGDDPIPNVDVVITDANGGVYRVTTDAFGHFEQTVAAGNATVDVDETDPDFPAGYTLTRNDGTLLGDGSDPTVVNVPADGTGTDNTGYVNSGADIGTVQGTIYIDNDKDGVYTPGVDTPLPNVAVVVTDVNGGVYTVT